MSAQVIFLTHFLGLIAGIHLVALQVSGPVKTVRLLLGERQVAVLEKAPWRADVDLGPDLTPRELTAVGLDDEGREVARATQILNLPRPTAEFDIALERVGEDPPTGAALHWRHLMNTPPKSARLSLDEKRLALDDKLHARLPKLDLDVPHVLAGEIQFADGFLARRELVIESVRSDSVGTQLTPIAVRETSKLHPASWDGCLAAPNGRAVRTAAVEAPRPLVIVVREPDPAEDKSLLDPVNSSTLKIGAMVHIVSLERGTAQRMIWPVGQRFEKSESDDTPSLLFPPSGDIDAIDRGFLRFLMLPGPPDTDNMRLQFADAVAVAGVDAVTGSQRRAVVLILSRKKDDSAHDPREVRRYLAALGVPLFVWSPTGRRPEAAAAWGEVADVSSVPKLSAAVGRLRRTLEEQRIAWVDVDPLTALRLKADQRCGLETLARP